MSNDFENSVNPEEIEENEVLDETANEECQDDEENDNEVEETIEKL